MSESSQTPNEGPAVYTKRLSLDQEETARLCARLLIHFGSQANDRPICRSNQALCSSALSACSSTEIQLCSTQPVVLEVRCARLRQAVLDMLLVSNETQSSPSKQIS